MSGYILCQTKKAQRPYFIENISMNIYSIEELCYYLYHNLYLADHTVFNEELCNWLRDELELVHLAANAETESGEKCKCGRDDLSCFQGDQLPYL